MKTPNDIVYNKYLFKFFLIFLIGAAYNCTEPIDIDDKLNFEDAIVIEATITNEFKFQKIFISRTFNFEDEGPSAETNASVQIVDGSNNIYSFTEDEPGVYISNSKFEALPGLDYQLMITTNKNEKYITLNKQLTNSTQIDELYASRETNSVGTEVMSIFVDSFDPNRNSNFYRYEYEETYKIIAPNWVPDDFVILKDEFGIELAAPGFTPRSRDKKVCYNTDLSNSIIQTSTSDLLEDRVSKFAVRNIQIDDAIISHRYSILVKQFVQSLEAFSYYDVLSQLSGSTSLFSQIQPGFINNNIFSVENKNEKVLGFFEVSSVSEKRIFFDYVDFFSNEELPPYFISCRPSTPLIATPGGTPLKDGIQAGVLVYFSDNSNPALGEGPYFVVPTACGDCTVLGTNVKPDFWIE